MSWKINEAKQKYQVQESIDWLIDGCLMQTLVIFQLYRGVQESNICKT